MPIPVTCKSCGKKLKAGDALAGKTVPCPNCKQPVAIVAADAEEEAATYLLKDKEPEPERETESYEVSEPAEPDEAEPKRRPLQLPRSLDQTPPAPLTSGETPIWLRHLHWLLALALIPLAFSLLQKDDADVKERFISTLGQLPLETQKRLDALPESATLDDVLVLLPDRKLAGALLPRDSWAHWGLAAGAAVLFLGFCMFLAADRSASPGHLLLVGAFTATIGIVLLLALQYIADATQGVWVRGGGIAMLIFYLVKAIGYSYNAALDLENGFFLSFIGFTLGVGFCEEVCKLLPVLWRYWRPNAFSWRHAFLWGLASGAGFGISEGITYSSEYYNGIHGPGIYVVRFLSCVALHALWCGSAAITLQRRQDLLHRDMNWYEIFVPILAYVAVPMVLHGLYDTFLKKDMNAGALAIAVLSFGFLAVQIYWLRGADDAEATEAMLQEYQRRRAVM